ncbi:hypothetical protein NC651_021759 [Populus alba x Populus x berolinensis]|nr:hypothetical protein NC651_021759 [Populus alba x Populus x berolinensis]
MHRSAASATQNKVRQPNLEFLRRWVGDAGIVIMLRLNANSPREGLQMPYSRTSRQALLQNITCEKWISTKRLERNKMHRLYRESSVVLIYKQMGV